LSACLPIGWRDPGERRKPVPALVEIRRPSGDQQPETHRSTIIAPLHQACIGKHFGQNSPDHWPRTARSTISIAARHRRRCSVTTLSRNRTIHIFSQTPAHTQPDSLVAGGISPPAGINLGPTFARAGTIGGFRSPLHGRESAGLTPHSNFSVIAQSPPRQPKTDIFAVMTGATFLHALWWR
jgi:hypothetical protein